MTTRIDIRLPEQELDRTQTEVIREFIRSLRKKVKNQ
ncbi:CopG family transcriptional regulator [uncultured Nostoc sp.]